MTTDELLARIATGEGPLCEFKENWKDSTEIREAIVGFANTVRSPDVGVLFLGLKPDGRPSGKISNADDTQRNVESWIKKSYPRIEGIKPHVLTIQDQAVVAIEIPESRNGPHFTGPAFKRVGSETKEASREMFEEMIADRIDAARILRRYVDRWLEYVREDEVRGPGQIRYLRRDGSAFVHHVGMNGLVLALDRDRTLLSPWAWDEVRLRPSPDSTRPPVIRLKPA
jgi:hypothetical protein